MLHARASGQRHREHVRLLPPVQAVAGHAATANGDNTMQTQKLSAIGSQALIIENVWNNFRLGRLLKHGLVLSQTNGAAFQISSHLHPVLCA